MELEDKYVTLLWETDVALEPDELPTKTLDFSFPGKFVGGEFHGKPLEICFNSITEPVTPGQFFSMSESKAFLLVAKSMLYSILRAARYGKFQIEFYAIDTRSVLKTNLFKIEQITLRSNESSTDSAEADIINDAN